MRRIGIIWSAALVLFLGICTLLMPGKAHAQGSGEATDQIPELSQDWEIRVGLYILQSKTSRNSAGEVGISGGIERRVYAGPGYDVTIGIGYNGSDQVYSIPIMANLIAHKDNIRYGAGFGYSYGRRLSGRGSSGTALELLAGYQLTRGRNPLSVDLRYYFFSGSSSELDGYSLTLGLKF